MRGFSLQSNMYRLWVAVSLVAFGIAVPPAPQGSASSDLAMHVVTEIGGRVRAAAAEGNRAYVAVHSRVVVYSSSAADPSTPLGVSPPTGGRIYSIAVRNDVVAVVGMDLVILDATDPSQVEIVSRLPLAEPGLRAAWIGSELWIAQGSAGLQRIELTGDLQPRSRGHWRPEWDLSASLPSVGAVVAMDGERAAVLLQGGGIPGDGDGTSSDCELLIVLRNGSAGLNILDREVEGGCHTMLAAGDSWVALGVGIADLGYFRIHRVARDGMFIDVEVLSSQDLGMDPAVSILAVDQGALWMVNREGEVWSLDLGAIDRQATRLSSAEPSEATRYPVALVHAGERALLLGPESGEWITPISQAGSLAGLSAVDLSVMAVGAADRGAWILDLSASIQRLQEHEAGGWQLSPTSIVVNGAAYAPRFGVRRDRLYIPRYIREQETFEVAEAIVGPDGQARLSEPWQLDDIDQVSGLQVLDVSEEVLVVYANQRQPQSQRLLLRSVGEGLPRKSAVVTLPERIDTRGAIDGSVVWVTTIEGGVRTLAALDASDVSLPRQLEIPSPVSGYSLGPLDAQNGVLALSQGQNIILVSVENPMLPQILGMVDVPGTVLECSFDGDLMWVSWTTTLPTGLPHDPGFGGLTAFDVTLPRWPSEVGSARLGAIPHSLAASHGIAWVGSEAIQGFSVGSPDESPTPVATSSPSPSPAPTEPSLRVRLALPHVAVP